MGLTTAVVSWYQVGQERRIDEDDMYRRAHALAHQVERSTDRLARSIFWVVGITLLPVTLIVAATWAVYDRPLKDLAEWMRRVRTGDEVAEAPPRGAAGGVAGQRERPAGRVVAREEGDGVLILSEFAGAARELSDALIINPCDTEQFADAIRYAVEMGGPERRTRTERMRRVVEEYNVYRWAANLLTALGGARSTGPITRAATGRAVEPAAGLAPGAAE